MAWPFTLHHSSPLPPHPQVLRDRHTRAKHWGQGIRFLIWVPVSSIYILPWSWNSSIPCNIQYNLHVSIVLKYYNDKSKFSINRDAKQSWHDIMTYNPCAKCRNHDDVIKWKHFPRYWPFVWGIHLSPVNSPHKGQWRGALMFSLISFCWVPVRYINTLKFYCVSNYENGRNITAKYLLNW